MIGYGSYDKWGECDNRKLNIVFQVCMSNNGQYIAVCNGSETIVYDVTVSFLVNFFI